MNEFEMAARSGLALAGIAANKTSYRCGSKLEPDGVGAEWGAGEGRERHAIPLPAGIGIADVEREFYRVGVEFRAEAVSESSNVYIGKPRSGRIQLEGMFDADALRAALALLEDCGG